MKEVQPNLTWVRVSTRFELSGVNCIYLTCNNHRLEGAGQLFTFLNEGQKALAPVHTVLCVSSLVIRLQLMEVQTSAGYIHA